jgi:hypothetical protein
MTETGWPLIPREVLPAPVKRATNPRRPASPGDPGRQLSIFGAETTEPSPADLAGLLAGPGRLGRMGGTARVTVPVDAAWRVHVLVAELVSRGLVVTWHPTEDVRGDAPPVVSEVSNSSETQVKGRTSVARPSITTTFDPDADPSPDLPSDVDFYPDTDPPAASADRPAPSPAPSAVPPVAPADRPASSPALSADPPVAPADRPAPSPALSADPPVAPADRPAPSPALSADQPADDPTEMTEENPEPPEPPETPAKPRFEVVTAYSSRLNALARAWPDAAAQLFLSGPRLRLWVAAAGEPVPGGYALGLDPAKDSPDELPAVDAALVRAGLAGRVSDDGRHYVIAGRRRLKRLAELVGERPAAAPPELWPGGAAA